MQQDNIILGIDIGGTGIKGSLVNIDIGEVVSERHRVLTPQPATPEAVAATFAEVVQHFNWTGQIGCGFPAIMRHGVAYSASNIDDAWLHTNVEELLSEASGYAVSVANDADVAGFAEMQYGAGKGIKGTVIMITIGTGIGSAVFVDGNLVPNTELGHLYLRKHKKIAEKWASNQVRKVKELEWAEWTERFSKYLRHVEHLFSPDLFILGGGVSKKFEIFAPFLQIATDIVPAQMENAAGVVGAAVFAREKQKEILL